MVRVRDAELQIRTIALPTSHHGNNPEKLATIAKIWSKPNKYGRTPLFIAKGFVNPGGLPRPDAPTLEAVTGLMLAAGLSTEGKRPDFVDRYAAPPKPAPQQK